MSHQRGVRGAGQTVTIPENHRARLMFYLHCVATTLRMDNDPVFRRFTDFTSHHQLGPEETEALIKLALIFHPNELIGKVFFESEELRLLDRQNKFYELEEVTSMLAVNRSVLVGGQLKEVAKIMMFRKRWMEKYYVEPLRFMLGKAAREAEEDEGSYCIPIVLCCAIM